MRFRNLVIAGSLLVFSTMACGPEQTAVEKEQKQRDQDYQNKMAVLQTVKGNYAGIITFTVSGKINTARLNLNPADANQADPSRIEVVPVPVLTGNLRFCADENPNCFKEKDSHRYRNLAEFNLGTYSETTKALYLPPITNASNTTTKSVEVRITATLVSPGHFIGTFTYGQTIDAGTIDVTRTSP